MSLKCLFSIFPVFSINHHHSAVFSSFGRILGNKIEGKVKFELMIISCVFTEFFTCLAT